MVTQIFFQIIIIKLVIEPVGMWARSQRVWSSCG